MHLGLVYALLRDLPLPALDKQRIGEGASSSIGYRCPRPT